MSVEQIQTVLKNITGKTRTFSFIPPRGRRLANNEEVIISGDILDALTSKRELQAYTAAIDNGDLELISAPANPAGESPGHGAPVQDLATLRAISAANREDKELRLVEDVGAIYRFDTVGVGADDGDLIIAPDAGTGRWFKTGADVDAHATSHTDGTDDIQNATAAQKGVATAAQITKLDGIATGADVTGSNAPQAHKDTHKSGGSDAFAADDVLESTVKRLQTTTGPTTLLMGAVADGELLKRSGTAIVGEAVADGGFYSDGAGTDAGVGKGTPAPAAAGLEAIAHGSGALAAGDRSEATTRSLAPRDDQHSTGSNNAVAGRAQRSFIVKHLVSTVATPTVTYAFGLDDAPFIVGKAIYLDVKVVGSQKIDGAPGIFAVVFSTPRPLLVYKRASGSEPEFFPGGTSAALSTASKGTGTGHSALLRVEPVGEEDIELVLTKSNGGEPDGGSMDWAVFIEIIEVHNDDD